MHWEKLKSWGEDRKETFFLIPVLVCPHWGCFDKFPWIWPSPLANSFPNFIWSIPGFHFALLLLFQVLILLIGRYFISLALENFSIILNNEWFKLPWILNSACSPNSSAASFSSSRIWIQAVGVAAGRPKFHPQGIWFSAFKSRKWG